MIGVPKLGFERHVAIISGLVVQLPLVLLVMPVPYNVLRGWGGARSLADRAPGHPG